MTDPAAVDGPVRRRVETALRITAGSSSLEVRPAEIRTATAGTSLTVGFNGHTGDRVVSSVTGPRRSRGTGFAIEVERTIRDGDEATGSDTLRWSYAGLD